MKREKLNSTTPALLGDMSNVLISFVVPDFKALSSVRVGDENQEKNNLTVQNRLKNENSEEVKQENETGMCNNIHSFYSR